MNSGNTDYLAFAGSSDHLSPASAEAMTPKAQQEMLSESFTSEQLEAFRHNRQITLELCDGFQAFYAANPDYHLDI